MKERSFLGHAIVYGAANLLTQAAGLVLTPLYTRCLSHDDFGAIQVLERTGELASTLLLVGGLRQGLMTLYQQKTAANERQRTVSAALALVFVVNALVGGLLIAVPALTDRLAHGLAINGRGLRLVLLAIFLEPFHLFPLALAQARLESVSFVAVAFGQFLTRLTLSIVFVGVFGWGVAGVFGATALTGTMFGIGLTGRELWRGLIWPDWRRMRALLRFALPMLPGGLCFFVMQHGDRFILRETHGLAEVGVYSLGYKLAQVVSAFSLAPLLMVWSSHMYAAARRDDAPLVFGRAFTRIVGAFAAVGLALLLFTDEAILLLGGASYGGAAVVIVPVLVAALCQSAASLMDAAFYIRHQTRLKLGVSVAATVVMTILYALLIPSHGGLGAALATLGGFGFLAVCTWTTTQRIFPIAYEWRRLGGLLALAAGLAVVSRLLPAGMWSLPVRAALWLVWPVMLWHLGLVSDDEKRYAVDFVRSIKTALSRPFRKPTLARIES
jgi:O-antigen/teichoic acid export membrane protein